MNKSTHRSREGSDWAGVRGFKQLMGVKQGLKGQMSVDSQGKLMVNSAGTSKVRPFGKYRN